jgi:FkbM family methyltransferase
MKEVQSYRYKVSLLINKLSKLLFKNEFTIRKKLKPIILPLLNLMIKNKGVSIKIGGTVECLLAPQYAFSNWDNFGQKHNSGFHHCINELKQGDTFIDIGAHIGLFTIPAAKYVGPKGKVYAFEPSASNFKMLNYHVELNNLKNVTTVNALLGSQIDESANFYEGDDINPVNSVVMAQKNNSIPFQLQKRKQITLDSYVFSNAIKPKVIKIDVEGSEINVLEGSKETINTHKPKIFLSYHPQHIIKLNQTNSDFIKIITDLNYELLDLNHRGNYDLHSNECVLIPKTQMNE